jgi:hypothetical protein
MAAPPKKEGQFPILAPGRAVGQVEYGAVRVSACDIACAGPAAVARERTADRTDQNGPGDSGMAKERDRLVDKQCMNRPASTASEGAQTQA